MTGKTIEELLYSSIMLFLYMIDISPTVIKPIYTSERRPIHVSDTYTPSELAVPYTCYQKA